MNNELSDEEEKYRNMFPEKWLCPYCMGYELSEYIDRDAIMFHLATEHDVNVQSWESLYKRMVQIGGI